MADDPVSPRKCTFCAEDARAAVFLADELIECCVLHMAAVVKGRMMIGRIIGGSPSQ